LNGGSKVRADILVLVVKRRDHDVYAVPDLIVLVGAGQAALGLYALLNPLI